MGDEIAIAVDTISDISVKPTLKLAPRYPEKELLSPRAPKKSRKSSPKLESRTPELELMAMLPSLKLGIAKEALNVANICLAETRVHLIKMLSDYLEQRLAKRHKEPSAELKSLAEKLINDPGLGEFDFPEETAETFQQFKTQFYKEMGKRRWSMGDESSNMYAVKDIFDKLTWVDVDGIACAIAITMSSVKNHKLPELVKATLEKISSIREAAPGLQKLIDAFPGTKAIADLKAQVRELEHANIALKVKNKSPIKIESIDIEVDTLTRIEACNNISKKMSKIMTGATDWSQVIAILNDTKHYLQLLLRRDYLMAENKAIQTHLNAAKVQRKSAMLFAIIDSSTDADTYPEIV